MTFFFVIYFFSPRTNAGQQAIKLGYRETEILLKAPTISWTQTWTCVYGCFCRTFPKKKEKPYLSTSVSSIKCKWDIQSMLLCSDAAKNFILAPPTCNGSVQFKNISLDSQWASNLNRVQCERSITPRLVDLFRRVALFSQKCVSYSGATYICYFPLYYAFLAPVSYTLLWFILWKIQSKPFSYRN